MDVITITGAKMYECCEALCEAMKALGPGIDGGKDSLSMAAKVNQPHNNTTNLL